MAADVPPVGVVHASCAEPLHHALRRGKPAGCTRRTAARMRIQPPSTRPATCGPLPRMPDQIAGMRGMETGGPALTAASQLVYLGRGPMAWHTLDRCHRQRLPPRMPVWRGSRSQVPASSRVLVAEHARDRFACTFCSAEAHYRGCRVHRSILSSLGVLLCARSWNPLAWDWVEHLAQMSARLRPSGAHPNPNLTDLTRRKHTLHTLHTLHSLNSGPVNLCACASPHGAEHSRAASTAHRAY